MSDVHRPQAPGPAPGPAPSALPPTAAYVDADVLGHVGVSKGGKTYTMQEESIAPAAVSGRRRFLVFARLAHEWPGQIPPGLCARAEGLGAMRDALAAGRPVTIVHPRRGEATREAFERVCAEALERGGLTVVVNEAHHYMPVSKPLAWKAKAAPGAYGAPRGMELRDSIEELVTAYRHYGCGLWWDTQRMARISTTVREQTEVFRLFAQGWKHDLDLARDIGGPELEASLRQVAEKFKAGERGYHVVLVRGDFGPFPLSR